MGFEEKKREKKSSEMFLFSVEPFLLVTGARNNCEKNGNEGA